MKMKVPAVVLLALLMGLRPGLVSATQEAESPDKPVIELEYRALQPGEVILATLKGGQAFRRAVMRFRGREYVLKSSGAGTGSFVFIGLDLGIEPGSYPMTVTVEKLRGADEIIRKDVAIKAKVFPEKKLWVKEEYAVPPKALQERIRREAEMVAWVYSLITPRWLGDGAFILPHEGKAFPNFGQRRIYNNRPRSIHRGVDIAAPRGDPIRAVNSGTIVLASDLYLSGKTVIIDHGLGVFSSYCHLSKILVARGAVVRKGDVIGRCGSTGRSTGPHLHWGMKIFDAHVDPFSFLGLHVD